MRLTDTHCHLDMNQFDADRADVIQRAASTGITRILIPSVTVTSSRAVVKLADSNPILFAAVGVHPNEADSWDGQTIAALKEFVAESLKVVAVGEIGLDYFWSKSPRDEQIPILKEQLHLAEELELPVIIHSREKKDAAEGQCFEDLLAVLGEWIQGLQSRNETLAKRPGVLHSFSGSAEIANRAMGLGFLIGITGPVTYRNAKNKQQLVGNLPLDHLLIETDSPYLTPEPHRGERNEPAFVSHIADKIAEIKSRTPQDVAVATSENAARLFSWGESV